MTRQKGKPPSQRQLRVGEELRHALVRIIARGEFRDPVLAEAQITVSEVRVSPDLRAATAFVLPLGGGESAGLVEALNRASAYFRGQLAREVELRLVPTVKFEPDRSFEHARRIETLLQNPAVARDLYDDGKEQGGDGA